MEKSGSNFSEDSGLLNQHSTREHKFTGQLDKNRHRYTLNIYIYSTAGNILAKEKTKSICIKILWILFWNLYYINDYFRSFTAYGKGADHWRHFSVHSWCEWIFSRGCHHYILQQPNRGACREGEPCSQAGVKSDVICDSNYILTDGLSYWIIDKLYYSFI